MMFEIGVCVVLENYAPGGMIDIKSIMVGEVCVHFIDRHTRQF